MVLCVFRIESHGIQFIIAYRTEKTKQTICILKMFILPRFSLSFYLRLRAMRQRSEQRDSVQ